MRRRYAVQCVRRGDENRDAGRPAQAEARYRDAYDALVETAPVACELVPEARDAVRDHCNAVESRLRRLEAADDQAPVSSGSH